VKNIEDDNWTKNYSYYDTKGRVIGTHSINHLGGYTKTESKLDFAGVPQIVITRHKRLETDTERVITENFEYDHQNRLLVHKHQIDNNPVEILTQNTYNELSQLESKKVGGIAIGSPLQQMDYKYNIRGWLTQINDPSTLNGKLFGYALKYQNPSIPTTSTPQYGGNISEVHWKTPDDDIYKVYHYAYDKLNRLNSGVYREPYTTVPDKSFFNEEMNYDLNGNITRLWRTGKSKSNTVLLVDDLIYAYQGNRLQNVTDDTQNKAGYEGGGNLIDYDMNGNMINMKDKGIQSISYNYLNLPDGITIKQANIIGGVTTTGISHLYRADGVKLRKFFRQTGFKATLTENITDYLDGFQYSFTGNGELCLECRTETAYEEQAYGKIINPISLSNSKWLLDFVPTSEGFYSFTENRYIYQYKDHLGNTRVSFAKDGSGALEVTDVNSYYPFGLNHIGGLKGLIDGYKSYKYNGKELQETGMYDYGWRNYMPDLGRWGVIDPMAENMPRHSPYNYAFNNPIKYIDIDGLAPGGPGDQGDGKTIDVGEVIITVRRKVDSFFTRLGNYFSRQFSPKTNADKYGGLNSYRQWQASPFYNEGETKMDRIFRLMGNSKREEMLEFGGGGYNMFGGYGRVLSTEAKVLNEAQTILKEEKTLRKIFELGTGQEVKIGGRTIVVEPEAPMSGLTLFEENAFVLGKDAFSSPLELRKTLLHELYRLNTSNLKGQNTTQGAVTGETKAAFDFAEQNAQKLK
ncbi:RHS repeat domain-containing protein, partial [Chryseobacterium jejuense]